MIVNDPTYATDCFLPEVQKETDDKREVLWSCDISLFLSFPSPVTVRQVTAIEQNTHTHKHPLHIPPLLPGDNPVMLYPCRVQHL